MAETTQTTRAPVDIDALEALHAKAWKGPWIAHTFEIDCPCPNGEDCGDTHTCDEVRAPDEYPEGGQCVVQITVPGLERFASPTAAAIAALHNAAPAMFAELRRLRAEVATARREAIEAAARECDEEEGTHRRAAFDALGSTRLADAGMSDSEYDVAVMRADVARACATRIRALAPDAIGESIVAAEVDYWRTKARVYGAIAARYGQALAAIDHPEARVAEAWRHSEGGGVPQSAIDAVSTLLDALVPAAERAMTDEEMHTGQSRDPRVAAAARDALREPRRTLAASASAGEECACDDPMGLAVCETHGHLADYDGKCRGRCYVRAGWEPDEGGPQQNRRGS